MGKNFQQIYDNSIKNPEEFWKNNSEDIFWFKKPTKILNKSNHPFTNGTRMALQTLVITL